MEYLHTDDNFLGLSEEKHYNFEDSKVVVQSLPYEFSSSYLTGSDKGPAAMVTASQFVEFYDDEIQKETCFDVGVCTLEPLNFEGVVNEDAMNLISKNTKAILDKDKFVVSLGAEHTITYGIVHAMQQKFDNLCVLQIDAHSDLRMQYQDNKWSHASVMARVRDLDIPLTQIGIRAQCKEEGDLIKSSPAINTWFGHQISNNLDWIQPAIDTLSENVYITIDADGFDPSIMPAVGTAEPGGLRWQPAIEFFKEVFKQKNVVAFDIVECAPKEGEILTEFNLAKLAYKLIGLKYL